MLTHGDSHGAPAGPDEHPELEELAALIDGRLSEDAAATLRSHLGSCAECREVFFETVDFVRGEEAGWRKALLSFDRRRWMPRRSLRAVIAYPAAALLAVGLSTIFYVKYFAPPDIPALAFALADDLRGRQQSLEGHFGDRLRGGGEAPEELVSRQSYRLGAELVNLQVSLVGKNGSEADAALAKINGLNAKLDPDRKVKDFYLGLRTLPPRELWQRAERATAMAQEFRAPKGPAENLFLDFGLWTEAGKLASWAADAHFLTSRNNRRFPVYLRQQLGKEGDSLPGEVKGPLRAIESILERDHLTAENYHRLARLYETILKAYDERKAD